MNSNLYKPLAFWSWNAALEISQLIEQIRDFKAKGFGGFFIHARGGLRTPYMKDEWFDCCKAVCQEAKTLELDVFLYDEDGWPSGFAGGLVPAFDESYCQKRLYITPNEIPAGSAAVASYQKVSNGDYNLIWSEEMKAPLPKSDLYVYYDLVPTYSDLTSPHVVDYFIKMTHEVYYEKLGDYFGNVIKGIFTDEPQLVSGAYHWGETLKSEYLNQHDEKIYDNLWRLECDGSSSELSKTFRGRYRALLQKLFTENYSKKIFDWCEAHRIISTGHLAAEDGQVSQIEASGGVMKHYLHYHMPAIDHLGRRLAPLPLLKQVQSVAGQVGRKRILSETFGCSGWNLSFEEAAQIWGWHAINGINVACLHLSAYSIAGSRKRDYPPVFSYQTPWWSEAEYLMQWITNVNQFLSESNRKVSILVIQPQEALWDIYNSKNFNECRRFSGEYRTLVETLRNLQLDFDIGDEGIIKALGKIDSNDIKIGERSYDMVFVSEMPKLQDHTTKLLKSFTDVGGEVIFIGNHCADIPGAEVSINHYESLRKHFLKSHYTREVKVLTPTAKHLAEGIHTFFGEMENGLKRVGIYPYAEGFWDIPYQLNIKGEYEVYQVDPLTNRKTFLPSRYFKEETFTNILLSGRKLELFELSPFKDKKALEMLKKNDVLTSVLVDNFEVEKTSENILLLDRAEMYIDSLKVSDNKPLRILWKEIQSLALKEKRDRTIELVFTFQNDMTNKMPISLALETEGLIELLINEKRIDIDNLAINEWFIDKGITKTTIAQEIKTGQNKIACRYFLSENSSFDYDKSFEAERNRFSPTFELECLYLVGDFSVSTTGNYNVNSRYISLADSEDTKEPPEFILKDSSPLKGGSVTPQGMWFYRGNIIFKTKFSALENFKRVFIKLKKIDSVFCKLKVNEGEEIPIIFDNSKVEITKHLKKGSNELIITLFGSNRNVFGPHNHCKGELDFIGSESFEGVLNWTDVFNPEINTSSTWKERYSFVPFGLDTCYLIYEN